MNIYQNKIIVFTKRLMAIGDKSFYKAKKEATNFSKVTDNMLVKKYGFKKG